MIRPDMILAVARAEARLTRRLVRYWVFVGLAAVFGLGSYAYYAILHWMFSSRSATIAAINPRYFMSAIGLYYLMLFMFGLVFLGFDVRSRDKRERIVEVLDSRPCTNLELMLGKFLGLFIACWIPVVVIAVVLALGGLAAGEPVEPLSLVSFSLAIMIPAFTFGLGFVFFVTLLVRHRGLAAVLLVAALIGLYTALLASPLYVLPAIDVTGVYIVNFPSDVLRGIADLDGWAQRLAVLLAGLGLIWLSAAIHPRLDQGSRASRAVVGLLMVLVGAGVCGGLALADRSAIQRKAHWREVHERRSRDAAPDLLSVSGSVTIEPGRVLREKLILRFRAPEDVQLATALFSLNPGLRIDRLTDAQQRELSFTQEDGLVEVRLPAPLEAGQEMTIEIQAEGLPDSYFAYLDSFIEPLTINPINGQLLLLGYEPFIYDRRYVALLPGARWLPAGGSEIGRDDPKVRPADFFQLDLEVSVPQGWLVAGPARRQERVADGRSLYRFTPRAALSGVALVAGRFKSRSREINGVMMEALVIPLHEKSIAYFDDAAGEIHDWLSQHLVEAEQVGLGYPYDVLSLVEIPMALRGYGGGWRMDTTMAQPAMLLMREAGFPTTRFDTRFRKPDRYREREGGLPRAKREVLEAFFESDFNGGNPFTGSARSFFGHLTSASGDEGVSLNYVCETLTTRLVSDKQGYFSAHLFNNKNINQAIAGTIGTFVGGEGGVKSIADALIQTVTSRAEVWDAVLGVSLVQLDPWKEPRRSLDVLTLKGGAMARSMIDGLGRSKSGQLLAAVRQRSTGRNFDREDVVAAGHEVGEDLEPWLDLWLDETQLPGFTLGQVSLDRIREGADGAPRYQMLVTVRNEEPTPGLLRLSYRKGDPKKERAPFGEGGPHPDDESAPVRIEGLSAVEIGVVTGELPYDVRVLPYLALNRGAFNVPLPDVDEERIVSAEPFQGSRSLSWSPPEDEAVIVDDLDPGFRVIETEARQMWRFGAKEGDTETDQGLPVADQFRGAPPHWSRQTNPEAWGKYRHTTAVVKPGKGDRKAEFTARIDRPGPWRLEWHFPQAKRGDEGQSRRRKLGKWKIEMTSGGDREALTFDADAAEDGWNSLGTFELAQGDVAVSLSDETDGARVIADAVRWTPVAAVSSR